MDDLMIRIIDQRTGKLLAYYGNLTEEQLETISELLNIKKDEWD